MADPKPRKARKIVGYKTNKTAGSLGKSEVKAASVKREPAIRVYKPADERTGAKSYGKESATKESPAFVKNAQAKKQEIVEKDGKKYRAGTTELKTGALKVEPAKLIAGKITMPSEKKTPIYETEAKKKVKLKARRMVYGGSDKDGKGKTSIVNRQTPKGHAKRYK